MGDVAEVQPGGGGGVVVVLGGPRSSPLWREGRARSDAAPQGNLKEGG